MNEDISTKINDIKGIVTIPDNSIFIFSALVIAVIIALVIISILIFKFFKNRKKNIRKEYFNILQNIDFSDSKKASYEITKYTRLISHNEREKKLSDELIEELQEFKYKKTVGKIPEQIKAKFSTFMDVVDV
jgi:flagellar biosynthesis/type III secretory pathway M-ring protein FliF/YscJ